MRLKELREDFNYTQKQVGEMIGTAQSNIARWENGSVQPTVEFVIKLAQLFQVSTDYLLGMADDFEAASAVMTPVFELTERERDLVALYRRMTQADQNRLIGFAEGLLNAPPAPADPLFWHKQPHR